MRIISSDKDGIAIEKVFYDDYINDSTGLGRNRGISIFNGKVMRPVYRQELFDDLADHFRMTEFDKNVLNQRAKPLPYWMTYLGKDTLAGEGAFEYNILFIKNSSLCQVRYHRNQAGQLHDFYDGVSILPEWPERELRIVPILKTFSFQVPFERNQSEILNEKEALYTDILDDFIVRGVKIWAYASVEGNTEINERLQRDRALGIKNSLEKYLSEEVKYRIIAKENWERFAEQLKGTTQDSLRQFSRKEIKDLLLKEDNLSAFDHLLYDQRKAVVKVFYNTKPQDYDTVHILQYNLRQALDSIASRKKANKPYSYYVRDAEGLHYWLYQELLKSKLSEQDYMSWDFPLDPTYHEMINNQFWYQYHHPEFQTTMMDNYIKLVGLDREASDVERFNLISYALEKEQTGNNTTGLMLEDLGRLMRSRAYHTIESEEVLKLAAALFGKLAVYYHQNFNTWDRRNLHLNDMVTLFDQDSTRDINDWIKLAELSAHLNNQFVANEIIDRYDSTNLEFLKLSLKLNYDHYLSNTDDFSSEEYYTELTQSIDQLGTKSWCELFDPESGLSFQSLDHQGLFELWSSRCGDGANP